MSEYVVLDVGKIAKEDVPTIVNLASHLPGATLLKDSLVPEENGTYKAQFVAKGDYELEVVKRIHRLAGEVNIPKEERDFNYNIFD